MLIQEIADVNLESRNIEFKGIIEEGPDNKGKSKEIVWLKTLTAFANTEGGTLYVGVEDKSHKVVASDHETADRIVLMVHRQLRNKVTPLINYDISAIPVPDTSPSRYIIKIDVKKSSSLPVMLHQDGLLGIYVRNFGRTDIATPEQIRDMILMSEEIPYDQPFTNEIFDPSKYKKFQKIVEAGGIQFNEKVLISRAFISTEKRLSKGALLFADDYDGEETKAVATLWPGLTKGDDIVLASEEYRGNLLEIIERCVAFVRNHSANGFKKEDIGQSSFIAFPVRSVTEGIVNAVGHRNYFMFGTQIEVNIFRDRLEITSPGSLIGVRELKKEKNISAIIPRRRNSVICAALEMCRYMEEKGSGFDKIAEDYSPYEDRYQPYITSDAFSFTLMLPDLTYRLGITDEGLPEIYTEGITTGKNDLKILAYCYRSSHSAKEIAEYIGITASTYFRTNTLGRLCREGYLLEAKGNNSSVFHSNQEKVKLKL